MGGPFSIIPPAGGFVPIASAVSVAQMPGGVAEGETVFSLSLSGEISARFPDIAVRFSSPSARVFAEMKARLSSQRPVERALMALKELGLEVYPDDDNLDPHVIAYALTEWLRTSATPVRFDAQMGSDRRILDWSQPYKNGRTYEKKPHRYHDDMVLRDGIRRLAESGLDLVADADELARASGIKSLPGHSREVMAAWGFIDNALDARPEDWEAPKIATRGAFITASLARLRSFYAHVFPHVSDDPTEAHYAGAIVGIVIYLASTIDDKKIGGGPHDLLAHGPAAAVMSEILAAQQHGIDVMQRLAYLRTSLHRESGSYDSARHSISEALRIAWEYLRLALARISHQFP